MTVYTEAIDRYFRDPRSLALEGIPDGERLAFILALADQMDVPMADLASEAMQRVKRQEPRSAWEREDDAAWEAADRRYHELAG